MPGTAILKTSSLGRTGARGGDVVWQTRKRDDVPYSEAAVEDLRQRLARTRRPDQIPGSHWDYGVSLDYMKEICQISG